MRVLQFNNPVAKFIKEAVRRQIANITLGRYHFISSLFSTKQPFLKYPPLYLQNTLKIGKNFSFFKYCLRCKQI